MEKQNGQMEYRGRAKRFGETTGTSVYIGSGEIFESGYVETDGERKCNFLLITNTRRRDGL